MRIKTTATIFIDENHLIQNGISPDIMMLRINQAVEAALDEGFRYLMPVFGIVSEIEPPEPSRKVN